jgi:hypothetical protein
MSLGALPSSEPAPEVPAELAVDAGRVEGAEPSATTAVAVGASLDS